MKLALSLSQQTSPTTTTTKTTITILFTVQTFSTCFLSQYITLQRLNTFLANITYGCDWASSIYLRANLHYTTEANNKHLRSQFMFLVDIYTYILKWFTYMSRLCAAFLYPDITIINKSSTFIANALAFALNVYWWRRLIDVQIYTYIKSTIVFDVRRWCALHISWLWLYLLIHIATRSEDK